jgi:hypothetical protein
MLTQPFTPRLTGTTPFPAITSRLQLITSPKRSNTTPEVLLYPEILHSGRLSYYVEQKYYTNAPVYYTTTNATPRYYTAASKYYTKEAAYFSTHAVSN